MDDPAVMKRLQREKDEYLYSLRLAGHKREEVELEDKEYQFSLNKEEGDISNLYGQEELVDRRLKPRPSAKLRNTFMNMGEDELVEEEEDNSPGISTLGHGELEAHREKRHYARLAAWEMPLLASEYSTQESPHESMGDC